ncbi:MAG: hypothetical protein ACLR67_11205, partial [Eggerthella lenta]
AFHLVFCVIPQKPRCFPGALQGLFSQFPQYRDSEKEAVCVVFALLPGLKANRPAASFVLAVEMNGERDG